MLISFVNYKKKSHPVSKRKKLYEDLERGAYSVPRRKERL